MMKPSIACIFFCTFFPLSALSGIDTLRGDAGFEAQHESVFLPANTAAYAPDTVSNTAGSVFCSIDLTAGNHGLFVQPGIMIKEQQALPFFRKLRYSLFTDRFSLSAGKDVFSFGEGIMKNYFFVHLPQSAGFGRTTYPAVWHTVFEFPVKQFLLSSGVFADADSTARWKVPKWYSLWAKAVYSNPSVSVGLEADALFQPELKGEEARHYSRSLPTNRNGSRVAGFQTAAAQGNSRKQHPGSAAQQPETASAPYRRFDDKKSAGQKKAYTVTAAAEISALLPYQWKLYANAQLPVDVLRRRITDWGALAGISKDFIFNAVTLSAVAEAAYSPDGFAYSIFQSLGTTGYAQFSAGLQGLGATQLIGIVQSEFFISDFSLKIGYVSKDMLEKQTTAESYLGILSIAVSFHEGNL